MHLAAEARERGYRHEHFEILGSTNDEAMRRARDGDMGPLWITAGTQSAGRGRLGRSWTSPAGNLHASLLLVDPVASARLPELGFVCGVALAETLGPRARLKWPNDALIGGAKVAGILLEAARVGDRTICVAGIGVNCVAHPDGLPYLATDLETEGLPAGAGPLFEHLSARLCSWLELWSRPDGFSSVRQAWLAHAAGLGGTIEVLQDRRRLRGVFRSIDPQGRLVIDTGTSLETIEAGDIFLTDPTAPHSAQGRN